MRCTENSHYVHRKLSLLLPTNVTIHKLQSMSWIFLAQLSSFKQWIFLLFYRLISPFNFLVDSFVSGKGNLWTVETSLKYVSQWYGCKLKFYIYYITEYSTKLTEKMVYNWIARCFIIFMKRKQLIHTRVYVLTTIKFIYFCLFLCYFHFCLNWKEIPDPHLSNESYGSSGWKFHTFHSTHFMVKVKKRGKFW